MGYKVFEEYMRSAGYSQTGIAKEIGIPQQTLSAWKTGRYTPNINKIKKISTFTGIPTAQLLDPDGEPEIGPVGITPSSASPLPTPFTSSTSSKDEYYINPNTAKIAQEIFENPELHALFDSARDADPDDLRTAHSVLLALKRKGQ